MRNLIVKMISGMVFMLLLLTIIIVMIIKKASTDINKITSNFTEKVGGKVIYKNDTLQIIDCSFINNTYILENGTEINYRIVDSTNFIPKNK